MVWGLKCLNKKVWKSGRELHPIFPTELTGHGLPIRDFTGDYTKLREGRLCPELRLILTVAHVSLPKQLATFCEYPPGPSLYP